VLPDILTNAGVVVSYLEWVQGLSYFGMRSVSTGNGSLNGASYPPSRSRVEGAAGSFAAGCLHAGRRSNAQALTDQGLP